MEQAFYLFKDAMLVILISITLCKIKHGDEHSFEKLLFIVLLFSF